MDVGIMKRSWLLFKVSIIENSKLYYGSKILLHTQVTQESRCTNLRKAINLKKGVQIVRSRVRISNRIDQLRKKSIMEILVYTYYIIQSVSYKPIGASIF